MSASFSRRHDLGDAVQDFQRVALRRPKAQTTGDGIDMAVHRPPSSPNSACWPCLGRGFGKVLNFQAVVVMAPLAARQHLLRDFLDGQVRERQLCRGTQCKGRAAYGPVRLRRSIAGVARAQVCSGDVDEVPLGGWPCCQ